MPTTTWLEIDPIDTLFFRGAESMVAGENHAVDTLFPPMPATLIGAIRTAFMRQNGIAPAAYLENPAAVNAQFPVLGLPDAPGFELTGPLFLVGSESLLLPAPAHWFADPPEPHKKEKWETISPVQVAAPLSDAPLGLSGSTPSPVWLRQPAQADMQPLSGWWATAAAFAAVGSSREILFTRKPEELTTQAAILPASALFNREERVGIALTPERTAKDGHLYSATHVRLREQVRIVAGITSEHSLELDQHGILQLGGEQRVCRYRTLKTLHLPKNTTGEAQSTLGPLATNDLPATLEHCPRASGKLLRIGGWDMAKKFHKPMTSWLPAGTVFFTKSRPDNGQFLTI